MKILSKRNGEKIEKFKIQFDVILYFRHLEKICDTKMVDTIYNLRPRRPPFFLVASEGIGVTSSIRPIFIPEI